MIAPLSRSGPEPHPTLPHAGGLKSWTTEPASGRHHSWLVAQRRGRDVAFPAVAVADHPPFDLIEAKLAPPPLRSGVVVKSDVIAPLCASPLPFASVIAPPGYGKTTLLALWAEKDPRPFAWVALDGRDDDAVLFLQYIAAALNRVEPLAPEVFDALSGPGGSIG